MVQFIIIIIIIKITNKFDTRFIIIAIINYILDRYNSTEASSFWFKDYFITL